MTNTYSTGGSDNLRGIHYQLIRSLFHANRILDLELEDSDEPLWSKLVLEPRDGGDLQLEAPDAIDVEQMKVSSRAWSLFDIIHEVLPDLYKAFVGRVPHRPIRQARFITDAGRGNWQEVEKFFRDLEPCTLGPNSPSAYLDDSFRLSTKSSKLEEAMAKAGLDFTKRGLFLYISRVVTKSQDPSPQDQVRVWSLLRAFRFEQAEGDTLRSDVLSRIRGRVLKAEDAEPILLRLLGDFLEKGKESAAVIARDVLARHGLADVQLKDRDVLVERGRRLLTQTLTQRRYNANHDVRAARWAAHSEPDITRSKPLIFWGQSGKGKSWALYARALSLAEQGRLVLLVDAAVDRTVTSEGAAAAFCREIWGLDGYITLERLSARFKTADPINAEYWLDLLVDGVQSLGLAEQLASYDWGRIGVRLSFSLTTGSARLATPLLELSRAEEIADFSTRELHDYFSRRLGTRALQVVYSEDSILHQPLMARIFCDLVGDESALIPPANEFQLLASYWADFARLKPFAVTAISALAAQPPGGRAYPWTMRTLRESGIDEAASLLLTEKGLLRRSVDNRTAGLWHDRLLSWAAAEGWVELIRDGRLTSDELIEYLERLRDFNAPEARWGQLWMGHAPLDVLWILLEPGWGFETIARKILLDLDLRVETLSALGDRVVSALFELVRERPDRSYHEIQALKAISSPEISMRALDLLRVKEVKARLAAAQILVAQPTQGALDGLWALRGELEIQEPQDLNSIYGIVDKALAACVRHADDWMRRIIKVTEPTSRPVHALVYLLPQMEHGRTLWFELKNTIFQKVSGEKARCIAVCLEEFYDNNHNQWLKDRVQENNLLGAAARRALFLLEPGRHPDPLDDGASLLGSARGWWLLPHVNVDPLVAESFITQTVARAEDPWRVAWNLLSGFQSRISPETLDKLLDSLSDLLARELTTPASESKDPFWGPFLFLAEVRTLRLIDRYRVRQGGDLDHLLAQWLCERGPNNKRYHRHREERAVRVLKRIGGEGLTRVAHCWLRDGQTFWALREAIQLSTIRPSAETGELLFKIAMREEAEKGDHPIAQLAAIGALLIVGRTDLAIRGVMKWGSNLSWEDCDLFGEYRPTAADRHSVLGALQEEGDPNPNIVLAVGLGGTADDVRTIHQILMKAPLGSELARTCLLALYLSKDRSDETANAFMDHLVSPQTEYVCALGLFQLRTPQALAELKNRIAALKEDRLSSSDTAVFITVNLLDIEDTRREVAEFLWSEIGRERILFIVQDDLMAFAELERSDVDDWLYGLALGEGRRHLSHDSQIGAIRAISGRDKVRAFDAALRLTELDGPNQEEVPKLLLGIDPERALPWIFERLVHEEEVIMLAAIGEALYASGHNRVVLDWFQDSSSRVRESACIVAEFFPWEEGLASPLRKLLYDPDWHVRNAANQALDHLWRAGEIDRLVTALLEEADLTRRWCLLDIVLEAGYPGLWQSQPWIEKLWEQLPLAMRQHASELLKKRRKEVRDALKKRKRRDS